MRFIGYESRVQTFPALPGQPVRFTLSPSLLELPELVVTGENPAINIMRRVIAEKQRWRATFETYKVKAYNRFRLENDTGIVSIWESSTIAFWDKERGIREISLAQKRTANTDIEDLLPAALFMKNLYDDDIEVAGHTIMGVTHKNALDHYTFTLPGTRVIDGKIVYDIDVRPSSKLGSGFTGSVAVLDETYALLSVDLEPGEAFLFPLPIKSLTVRYRQQYSQFGSDVWLPVDLRSSLTLDISFQGLLSFPTFHIEQFTRLSDFELNIPVPDSLYESNEIVAADSTMIAMIEPAKLEDVAIPLTEEELIAYETIDSTMTIARAFKPRGLLARFVNTTDDSSDRRERRRRRGRSAREADSDAADTGSSIGDYVELSFSEDMWYNQVEGFHLGGGVSLGFDYNITLSGRAGYQTARKGWTYGADVRVGRRRWIEVGYLDHVPRRYRSAVRGRLLNSLSVLFSEPDYYDYFHEERLYVSVGTRIPGLNAATAQITLSDSRHRSEVRNISGAVFGTPSLIIPNAPIDEGSLQSVFLRLRYTGGDSVPYGIGGEYSVQFDVEQSLGGSIVEAGHFIQFSGALAWRIPTFYNRRFLPNTLDFKIVAGTYSGHLPRQRFGIVDGSAILATFGGLRTRKERPYEGESYAAFLAEHSFRTILFERLGLRKLVRYGWNIILTGAVAKTWVSDGRAADLSPAVEITENVHTELGISLSGLFGLVRIDYARRMDASGYTVGITVARIF